MICDTEVCGLGISTSLSQGSFVIHAVGTELAKVVDTGKRIQNLSG